MQILGKVPSARRPPANLPSLKAETSDQTGTWPATAAPTATTTTTTPSSTPNNQQIVEKKQSVEHAKQQNNTTNNSGHSNNNNNHNNSASWSSTKPVQEPAPPKPLLYQSPQFQHEFPSLDGSSAQPQSRGSRGTANPNQMDGQHNTHTHNNNNQNVNANAADTYGSGSESHRTQNENIHSDQQIASSSQPSNEKSNTAAQAPQQVLPPQFKALMPQFMHRLKGFDNIAPEDPNAGAQSHYGHRDNHRNSGRDHQYQYRNRDRNDDRYRRAQRQRQEPVYDDYDTSFQGIIKEEELERLDKIVKDECAHDDEIDYNQKLSFSDDDSDTPPPTKESKLKESKRVNFSDRNKEAREAQRKDEYNREKEQQMQHQRDAEKEKLEREREQIDRVDRDKIDVNRQNGHRGIPVLDAEVLERVKQRKEEEEKRAHDRRVAAHRKLQELEQKLGKKKDGDDIEQSPPPTGSYAKDNIDPRNKTNDRYGRDETKPRDGKVDGRDYGSRYDRDSKYDRELGSRDRGTPNSAEYYNKPYQSNLPPRFQKQRDQQDRHPAYKTEQPLRSLPRDHMRRPNPSLPQNYIAKGRRDMPRRDGTSISSDIAIIDSDDEHVSSGRESISRNSASERPTILTRSTSDSSQTEFKEKIGSWADEAEQDYKPTQRQISSTSSANEDIQPKQILQRSRKVSVESRSDKEKSEEREIAQPSSAYDDVSKHFGTSPIEAPKSWADSSSSSEITIRENASETSKPIVEADKKPLEKVLENVSTEAAANEAKGKADEKIEKQANRSFSSSHSKDPYSSDDGKHGSLSKRPNTRNIRHENARTPSSRNYGQSYRGQPKTWNNRRGPSRFNEYSESEGSEDDEYHGRGNRGKDERFRQTDSSGKGDQQSQPKNVFVPRGEPSRRGRGSGRPATGPMTKRIDNYGPPNSKSPFGSSDDKSEKITETKTEDPAKISDAPQLDSGL